MVSTNSTVIKAVGCLTGMLGVSFLAINPAISQTVDKVREAFNRSSLIACAAPNNLPFSNKDGDGFENRIAQLVADELKIPLSYRWYPQSVGFVRRTLKLRECDLILSMPVGNGMVQNTNSYYHSVYTMIYRSDSGITATTVADPELKTKRIGVIAGTPPATLLALHDLLGQVQPYQRTVDTRHDNPARDAVQAVADGELDVAMIWGPIAGYFADQQPVEMTVVPLLDENPAVRLSFRISMAVRFREPEWKRLINRALTKLQPRIDGILREYRIPLLDNRGRLIIAASSVPEPDDYRMDDYGSPVPTSLAGATVVDARQVKLLISAGRLILVDVLPAPPKPKKLNPNAIWVPVKRQKIPGTHWLANVGYGRISNSLDAYFRNHLDRLTEGDKARPMVIYCLAECWMSWNAAKRALEYGYQNVYWFPEGIDGWEKENWPTEGQLPVPMNETD